MRAGTHCAPAPEDPDPHERVYCTVPGGLTAESLIDLGDRDDEIRFQGPGMLGGRRLGGSGGDRIVTPGPIGRGADPLLLPAAARTRDAQFTAAPEDGSPNRWTLSGGPGPDRLWGGPGDDVVLPGAGLDYAEGSGGSDRILARGGSRDYVTCAGGHDTVVWTLATL